MRLTSLAALLLALGATASAQGPRYEPPRHTLPAPLVGSAPPGDVAAYAELGLQIERGRGARDLLAEHRRLEAALAAVGPGRPGVPDAFVVAAALDSDPVFGREAREAARVLARRYGAGGRVITLAGSDGSGPSRLPMGSPDSLAAALARVAELMRPGEDVLVLYLTTHGAPLGLVYNDGDQGFGAVAPARLWNLLRELGIERRIVFVSACYSGIFVPMLSGRDTAVVTASSADRTSFGCKADSDWTFFGDALVNRALRKPQPLRAAAEEAAGLVERWERGGRLDPSNPQVSMGPGVARWLAQLERALPPANAPVGRPAITQLTER